MLLCSPAMRCLGQRGLFLWLVAGWVRHQVAAHTRPCPVARVDVAVFHLFRHVADALREPLPILALRKRPQGLHANQIKNSVR